MDSNFSEDCCLGWVYCCVCVCRRGRGSWSKLFGCELFKAVVASWFCMCFFIVMLGEWYFCVVVLAISIVFEAEVGFT